MINEIKKLIETAIKVLQDGEIIPKNIDDAIQISQTKDSNHGDFACNYAMVISKKIAIPPRELAQKIIENLPSSNLFAHVEVAGPGFINFTLKKTTLTTVLKQIKTQNEQFGKSTEYKGKRILVEYLSTNPTGPLHVGHGRVCAFGDSLVRVLRAMGYCVESEYYVNDSGRQMDILNISVLLRYVELKNPGNLLFFPKNAYQGQYINKLAKQMQLELNGQWPTTMPKLDLLPKDDEEQIDALISYFKAELEEKNYTLISNWICLKMVDEIKADLSLFQVYFDNWFHEKQLSINKNIEQAMKILDDGNNLYVENDATWFCATKFGDEKDRVVIRSNGTYTYFALDIAYHYDKISRGYDLIVDIMGADHHGYTARMYAALTAAGYETSFFTMQLVQFAYLSRSGERVAMSTRSGVYNSLRGLIEEVGCDAARFNYLFKSPNQDMVFDLDIAKERSSENPVFYVQYAHARICSVIQQAKDAQLPTPYSHTPQYTHLNEEKEIAILKALMQYPETVKLAAKNLSAHHIAFYLVDLSKLFHTYYNAHPFLSSPDQVRLDRLGLIDSIRIVIANGLELLGVSAPKHM